MPAIRRCGDLKGDGGFYLEPNWLPVGTLLGHTQAQVAAIEAPGPTVLAKANLYQTALQLLLTTSLAGQVAVQISPTGTITVI